MSKNTTLLLFPLLTEEMVKNIIYPEKIGFLNIKVKEEIIKLPTTNLYNLSKYFRIIIDNMTKDQFNNEISFDDEEVKWFFEYICFNVNFHISKNKILNFIIFCDYIQMNERVYKIIYIAISRNIENIENIDKIIAILFPKIEDKYKIELYNKFSNTDYFNNITYNDFKIIVKSNTLITEDQIQKFNNREDIDLKDKNEILMNLINYPRSKYELYTDKHRNYYLKSINYYNNTTCVNHYDLRQNAETFESWHKDEQFVKITSLSKQEFKIIIEICKTNIGILKIEMINIINYLVKIGDIKIKE